MQTKVLTGQLQSAAAHLAKIAERGGNNNPVTPYVHINGDSSALTLGTVNTAGATLFVRVGASVHGSIADDYLNLAVSADDLAKIAGSFDKGADAETKAITLETCAIPDSKWINVRTEDGRLNLQEIIKDIPHLSVRLHDGRFRLPIVPAADLHVDLPSAPGKYTGSLDRKAFFALADALKSAPRAEITITAHDVLVGGKQIARAFFGVYDGLVIRNFSVADFSIFSSILRADGKDAHADIVIHDTHIVLRYDTYTLYLSADISAAAAAPGAAPVETMPGYFVPASVIKRLKLNDTLGLNDTECELGGVSVPLDTQSQPGALTLSGKDTIRAIKAQKPGKGNPVFIGVHHGVIFIGGQPVTATPASFERYEAFRSAVREDVPRISMKYGGTLYTGDQQTGVVLVGRFQAIRWQLLETIGGIHFYALSRVWRGADGRSYEAPAGVLASAIIITEIIREACSAAGGDMIYGLAKYTWRFGGQLTGLFVGLRAITLTDYRAWQAAQTDAVPMQAAA